MNVPLKKSDEFRSNSFNEKVEYYLECVSELRSSYRTIDTIIKNRQRFYQKYKKMGDIYDLIIKGEDLVVDETETICQDMVDFYFD